jgi:hypothetical protein
MDPLYTVPAFPVKCFLGVGPAFVTSGRRPAPWIAAHRRGGSAVPSCSARDRSAGGGPDAALQGRPRGCPRCPRVAGSGRLGDESLSDHLLDLRKLKKSRTYDVSAGSGHLAPVWMASQRRRKHRKWSGFDTLVLRDLEVPFAPWLDMQSLQLLR